MIDSHCHLQFEQFDSDRDKLINELKQSLEKIVLAGVSAEDNLKAWKLAEKHEFLTSCMGSHPLYEDDTIQVRKQIEEKNPSAVGEIGLDYHYITDEDERAQSKEKFRQMLEIAENQSLGAVIHSRNAEEDVFDIVQSYDVECFFHCFNGRPELAEKITEEGHLVGVTGQVMDSNRVRKIVDTLGIEHVLTETDSPYLGPDKRNTPFLVQDVVDEIAEIKGIESERVSEVTSDNARKFFRVT